MQSAQSTTTVNPTALPQIVTAAAAVVLTLLAQETQSPRDVVPLTLASVVAFLTEVTAKVQSSTPLTVLLTALTLSVLVSTSPPPLAPTIPHLISGLSAPALTLLASPPATFLAAHLTPSVRPLSLTLM